MDRQYLTQRDETAFLGATHRLDLDRAPRLPVALSQPKPEALS